MIAQIRPRSFHNPLPGPRFPKARRKLKKSLDRFSSLQNIKFMTNNSSLQFHIQDSQFPKNSSEGAAVPLAQSEWLLEPPATKDMKGWVRDGNCPVPWSLQHNYELQSLCERPLLKIRRSALTKED